MKRFAVSIALTATIIAGGENVALADASTKAAELLQRLQTMEDEMKALRSELRAYEKQTNEKGETTPASTAPVTTTASASASSAPSSSSDRPPTKSLNSDLDPGLFGLTYRSTENLRLGAYGEVAFGRQETADGWRNGFDAGKVVLLGTYAFTDSILFNTEIEFEHGGIAKDADDKLEGAIEIEQLFVDFKINDYVNWRSPGVDVVPMGYIGLFHEPTQFYSVDRPELYNGLIPSTWFEGATSVYGKVVDGLTYQLQVSTGLEDAGTSSQESDGKVPEGGYAPGISGTEALGLARASISDRKQLGNNLGYAGRLAYNPSFLPGLAGSTSFYYTSDTSPRGAYGTNLDGETTSLGKSSLSMVDTELRYRLPQTGAEFRAEYVQVYFGSPENLRANNDADAGNNVGDNMYGYSLEGAYHFDLTSVIDNGWEAVPFYRYTFQNLQTGGFEGNDANDRTGAGRQDYHTFGLAVFPTPKLVLKLDYQRVIDDAVNSPKKDHLLGSMGFFF